jgi:hypothetical protein
LRALSRDLAADLLIEVRRRCRRAFADDLEAGPSKGRPAAQVKMFLLPVGRRFESCRDRHANYRKNFVQRTRFYFPVDVEGQKIKAERYSHRRCGGSRRRFEIVERLNEDEARREEDKWSA